jgi:hypothetical protein
MSQTPVTHYAPWDAPDDFAYCGVFVSAPDYHSPAPTCPVCAAKLAAECAIDEAIETAPWPLDADEASAVLDPVLNAGVPEPTCDPRPFITHLLLATTWARHQGQRTTSAQVSRIMNRFTAQALEQLLADGGAR